MANWFSQMFTPQRQGPGQMAWRDIVNEDSGEFSTGDMQEMYWKRNPAKTGNPGQMSTTSPGSIPKPLPTPLSQPGTGVNPLSQMTRDMEDELGIGGGGAGHADRILGLEPGGMSEDISITEQGPSGSIGANIAETMRPRQTMTPGSSRWSGVSMNDNWIQDPYQAPNAFSTGDTDPLKRIRALREHPSDATFYEGSQGIGEQQGQDMMHALALQDSVLGAGSNDAALQPGPTTPSVSDGFGESREQDYMGGQQTEPTAIAQLMKLIGSGAGNMFSRMFSPSQAGAGSPGPTVPNLNPPGPGARFAGPMLDRPGTFGGSRRMY